MIDHIKDRESGVVHEVHDSRIEQVVVYIDYQTDNTVEGLVAAICNDVKERTAGMYIYNGGWYQHTDGFNSIVIKHKYASDSGSVRISGIIFEYSHGYMYSFTRLYDGTIKISPSFTTMEAIGG